MALEGSNAEGFQSVRRGISSVVLESPEVEHKRWGRVEIIVFTANFMVGTGFLTLPAAISQAGMILGSLVLIATGLMSVIASDCILEATARTVPMKSLEEGEASRQYGATSASEQGAGGAVKPDELSPSGGAGLGQPWVIPDTRLEMPQLCEIWLGGTGRRVYMVCVILYIYASLWAYAVLVAQTLSVALPMSSNPADAVFGYWFYLLAFGVVAVFMATRDITGPFMTLLSMSFSYGRMLMCFLMVCTLTHALLRSSPIFSALFGWAGTNGGGGGGDETSDVHSDGSGGDDTFVPSARAPMWRVSGAVQAFTTSIFSVVFHHSVPTLAEPAADKSSVHTAFAHTVALVVLAYLLVTVPSVAYFGEDCLPAVSLNWATYSPDYWPPLAAFVRNFIVFFPALSLLSTYPLLCITLANNLSSVLAASFSVPIVLWRLVSSIPPILLAAFISDLGAVSAVAGVFGLSLILVFPLVLQHASRSAVEERFGASASLTVYGSPLTRSRLGMGALAAVGCALTVASAGTVTYQLVLSPLFTLIAQDMGNAEWGGGGMGGQ